MSSVTTDRRKGLSTSVAIKAPCCVATTANITLSGEQTVDGVAVVTGDRVLVANQTDNTENGIYHADTSSWTRAEDFDSAIDIIEGTLVYVNNGTAGSGWYRLSSTGTITPGTSAITFVTGVTIFEGIVSNANATAITITSDEVVLIGTTNEPSNSNTLTPLLVMNGNNSAGSAQIIRHTAPGTGGAHLTLSTTRGTDVNSYTVVQNGDGIGTLQFSAADGDQFYNAASISAKVSGTPANNSIPADLVFTMGSTIAVAIDSSGNLLVGPTASTSFTAAGVVIYPTGKIQASVTGDAALEINRLTNDGNLVLLYQDGSLEGAITVTGTTVTYGSFCGGHWSQLTDNANQTITKGTVVSTIDEMCYWERDETTVNEEGEEVLTGNTLIEDNDQLVKFKVSDTVNDKRVYGIFSNWDEGGDANIHALGATMCRVTGPCNGGDLLTSNGDGTAIVQDDDLIHSYTLGKVTFGFPSAGDADENLVPVVLYAG